MPDKYNQTAVPGKVSDAFNTSLQDEKNIEFTRKLPKDAPDKGDRRIFD
ncbi:hypothetical protein H1S01_18545 [Heliobacterium chlorum]|uniref:Uncharacterized protein n=1 Tax=Heliobacterium chlorum TaxID=2698 RepID=A0ABR7T918_HELCL|nr:hypothetical protein [Heliobacterium chlorum]MBC9786459.1 hypothetical protein [Heliobacterium chlorum]